MRVCGDGRGVEGEAHGALVEGVRCALPVGQGSIDGLGLLQHLGHLPEESLCPEKLLNVAVLPVEHQVPPAVRGAAVDHGLQGVVSGANVDRPFPIRRNGSSAEASRKSGKGTLPFE